MKFKPIDQIIDDISKEKSKILALRLDKYSLGNGQFQILNEIAWNDGISQEKISEKRGIDKAATARSVKKLIDKGYIYKDKNEKDNRAFCLHCSEKGKQMIPKIRDIIDELETVLSQNIEKEEILKFKEILNIMQKNIEKFLEEKK